MVNNSKRASAPVSETSEPLPDTNGAAEQPKTPKGRKGNTLNISELKDMSNQKLTQVAKDLNVTGATGMRKQELIFQILKIGIWNFGFI